MRTDPVTASATAVQFSGVFGVQVDPLYNPTQGWRRDAIQTAITNKLFSASDATTRLVVEYMRDEVSQLTTGQVKLMIAHSQGGAILSAALGYLSPAEREKIVVVTVGDAAWTFPSDVSVNSLSNVVDGISLLLGGGYAGDQSGRRVDYTFFMPRDPGDLGDRVLGGHYVDAYIHKMFLAQIDAAEAKWLPEKADRERRRLTVERMNRK